LAVAGVALPVAMLNVPAVHAVHTRSFWADGPVLTYWPSGQLVNARQVRLLGVLNWPTGQLGQTVFDVGVPAAP